MKKLIKVFIVSIILGGIIFGTFCYINEAYKDEIYMFYREKILKVKENIVLEKNEYYKDNNYSYVQNTDDFVAKDYKHLLNIFYTVVNSGASSFTFYCDDSYKTCTEDIIKLTNEKDTLSNLNNFVHPFNSFESINTSYDKYGEVQLEINKVYTESDIIALNKFVDNVISKKITNKMDTKKKISVIHNYIINHGRYATDKIRESNKGKTYNKANDILIDGYGLCSSYADAMALFLYRFDVDNYKIASESHIWNLVKINKTWLHLDLTWDDPVTQNGADKLEVLFMLIDNNRLKKLNVEKHEFDKNVYKEALN